MRKKTFWLSLVAFFPFFVFAAIQKDPTPAHSLAYTSSQITKQTSKIGYYMLLTILIIIIIFSFLVFLKRIKKK